VTTLDTPLAKAAGFGAATAKLYAAAFGVATVGDLMRHYPRRYEERGKPTDIGSLVIGEDVTVQARVTSARARDFRQRSGAMFEVIVEDASRRTLKLTFFGKSMNAVKWREKDLVPGRWGLFAGTVSEFNGVRQLTHPDYQMIADDDVMAAEEYARALIPVYPATQKIRSWEIAKAIRVLLEILPPPPDPLPASLRARHRLMDLPTALRLIHRPSSWAEQGAARKRLIWDEALAVQISLVRRKRQASATPALPRPPKSDGLLAAFDAALPYELTAGQLEIGAEIAADLAATHAMHRLLQGEVGSGKTVCALRGMLQVVDAGGQAALLAPTEVLALQHYRSIRALLGPLGRAGELDEGDVATQLALVTGSQSAAARRKALADAASGAAGIVIGTHALLYEGVNFADLGLVVVDEQHRFGVEQRDVLRTKAGQPPHVLVMTATPIPRTVAMTVFGDLDTSILAELPHGRSPIVTHVVPAAEKPAYLARAWQRVREEVEAGHQAYVVCPRIGGESAGEDATDLEAAGETAHRPPLAVLDVVPELMLGPLEGLRVRMLHGRMPADEKDTVMRDFSAGKVDVLVATTVIEVGVDVPNATVMVVLDADRFGISQLHQLRGRVGRGSAPGLCLLHTDAHPQAPSRARLDAVASTLDGFRLAELDLELRREGDVLGAAQSGGRSHLRLLSLRRDEAVIVEARAEAIRLLDDDPELGEHPALAASVAALIDAERAEFLEKG
jgi:ATP-dependent DNA helicase RecG